MEGDTGLIVNPQAGSTVEVPKHSTKETLVGGVGMATARERKRTGKARFGRVAHIR